MTDQRDVEVTHHCLILADFEMRKPQFAFLVLQRAFDGPTCESNVQPGFEFVFEGIPNEKPLFFFRVQRIIGPDEMVAAEDFVAAPQPVSSAFKSGQFGALNRDTQHQWKSRNAKYGFLFPVPRVWELSRANSAKLALFLSAINMGSS